MTSDLIHASEKDDGGSKKTRRQMRWGWPLTTSMSEQNGTIPVDTSRSQTIPVMVSSLKLSRSLKLNREKEKEADNHDSFNGFTINDEEAQQHLSSVPHRAGSVRRCCRRSH